MDQPCRACGHVLHDFRFGPSALSDAHARRRPGAGRILRFRFHRDVSAVLGAVLRSYHALLLFVAKKASCTAPAMHNLRNGYQTTIFEA